MKLRRESEIQAAILAYLSTRRDVFCWRANTGGVKYGQSFVKFGTRGAADIQGVLGPRAGRFFGIEVKREGKHPTPAQEAWGAQVQRQGGIYIVARSVDDVERGLGHE